MELEGEEGVSSSMDRQINLKIKNSIELDGTRVPKTRAIDKGRD